VAVSRPSPSRYACCCCCWCRGAHQSSLHDFPRSSYSAAFSKHSAAIEFGASDANAFHFQDLDRLANPRVAVMSLFDRRFDGIEMNHNRIWNTTRFLRNEFMMKRMVAERTLLRFKCSVLFTENYFIGRHFYCRKFY